MKDEEKLLYLMKKGEYEHIVTSLRFIEEKDK